MHKLLIFNNQALLRQALTHRSYVNEHPGESEHNERLEFLGDAILNFLSGNFLFKRYPDVGEGELTRRRSALVEEKQLAKFAQLIGLESEMLLGKGAIREGGYQNPNLLSSTFEAVVGAYYLDHDSNIAAVRNVVEDFFESVCEQAFGNISHLNPKNHLQEWVQGNLMTTLPEYNTERIGGTDNAPQFLTKVVIKNLVYGEGQGTSKAKAEELAAIAALAQLKAEKSLNEEDNLCS
jgi:ribonuclease-3